MSNQMPNQNKADQQRQNQDQKRSEDQKREQDQKPSQKDEIRKAVEQDKIDPNNPQGQQDTEYSGGS